MIVVVNDIDVATDCWTVCAMMTKEASEIVEVLERKEKVFFLGCGASFLRMPPLKTLFIRIRAGFPVADDLSFASSHQSFSRRGHDN